MTNVWKATRKFEVEHPRVVQALKTLGLSRSEYQKALDARAPVAVTASNASGVRQKGK